MAALMLCACSAPGAVETTTTGYENVPRTDPVGTLLSSPRDNGSHLTGRTTTVQYVGGWIWIGAEGPGSHSDADREWKVYNIEDPKNPIRMRPSDFDHDYPDDSWGSGNYGWNAHASAHIAGNTLSPSQWYGSLGRRSPGVATWGGPFELLEGISFPHAGWGRGTMAGPWGATFQWYGSDDRDFQIRHKFPDGDNRTLATWDHIGQFGGGDWHPIFFGDLLIYARSGGADEDGIVVYRLVYNDFDDPDNASITPQFVASLPGSFKGYWPNLCSDGSGLYVMGAHTRLFMLADITAAAEPGGSDAIEVVSEYTKYGPRNATYPVYQDRFAFIDEFKVDLTKMIAGDPDPVVLELDEDGTGVDCSQISLPLGNLWLTGGYGTGGMGVWLHQQEADTTRPKVAYHIPQSGRTNYPLYAPLSFLIHETPKKGCMINGQDFMVRKVLSGGSLGAPIAGHPIHDMSGVFTFDPEAALDPDSTYQVDFIADSGNGHGFQDAAGNYIEPYSFRFSTGSGVAGDPPPTIDAVTASDERPAPAEQITINVDATVTGSAEYRFNFDGSYGAWGTAEQATHTFAEEGRYRVLVQVRDDTGFVTTGTVRLTVISSPTGPRPTHSSTMAIGDDDGSRHLWVVNPDADTVAVLDAVTGDKLAERAVGKDPRNIARDADGRYWVSCHDADEIHVLEWNATHGRIATHRVIDLAYGSAPFGVCATPDGSTIYVTYFGSGRLARFRTADPTNPEVIDSVPTARAIAVSGDGSEVYVTRFISGPRRGQVVEYAASATELTESRTISLTPSNLKDGGDRADGVPNYLSGISIAPDGSHALVTSKQDNTGKGLFFGEQVGDLSFETTVRAVVSVIDLDDDDWKDFSDGRRDFDNSADPSAIAFSPDGDYALLTLQGNNMLVGFDTFGNLGEPSNVSAQVVLEKNVGLAPQGLLIDDRTQRVYVQNFMDRTLTVLDASPLIAGSRTSLPLVATTSTVAEELLNPAVLLGKQIFYNAADPRMSADGYISCATCHIDGGSDGRVWDFTGRGEGLRRTTDLRGRAGVAGHGNVHWSANFDEIQDFEHDMRGPFGGTGFIDDGDFASNHPNPGSVKRGLSEDLDALAAYVTSLDRSTVPKSPHRQEEGSLTDAARRGAQVFEATNCASCHSGSAMTDRLAKPVLNVALRDVGTTTDPSGGRLGRMLLGIDVPTLWGVHRANAYLHHGLAPSLEEVFTFTGGQMLQAEDTATTAEIWRFQDVVSQREDYYRVGSGWPGTVRRFWYGGKIVEIKADREDVDGDGVLDDGEDHNNNGRLDVYESGLSFAGVDGGDGGAAQLTIRYAVNGDTDVIVRVNGTEYATTLDRNGPYGRSDSSDNFYQHSLSITLAGGTDNTIEILHAGDRDFFVDCLWVANEDVLQRASAHRQVQDLSDVDRTDLLAYLQQVDGRDAWGRLPQDLVAWWRMDETAGSIATDSSPDGNTHPGMLTGGAGFVSGGRLGGGIVFDGVDDQVDIANPNYIDLIDTVSERTVSAWFRAADIGVAGRKQVLFENGDSTRGLALYLHDGRLYGSGWNTPAGESNWSGTHLHVDSISADTWHHVALTLHGGAVVSAPALVLYLDGEPVAVGDGSQLFTHGGDITLGATAGSRFHDGDISAGHHFAGRLDEVRVYNRALRDAEIRALFADASGVNRSWWTGLAGSAVADLSGSGGYPAAPTGRDQLDSLEAVDWDDHGVRRNWDDDYGQRMEGYIQAPEDGDYVFWISSDAASELWLSPDHDPANAVLIAEQPTSNAWRTWSADAGQRSAAITLQAGERYAFRALHKAGSGGDHLAVAWRRPSDSADPADGSGAMIVPGSHLEPLSPPWLIGFSGSRTVALGAFHNGAEMSGVLVDHAGPGPEGTATEDGHMSFPNLNADRENRFTLQSLLNIQ